MAVVQRLMHSAGGLALLIGSVSAWGLPTATFQVSASVVAGCVVSGTNTGVFGTLDFGTQSGVASNSVSASYVQSTTITLACTPGTAVSMSINGGNNYTSTRNLKNTSSTNTVAYSLFTNAAHTVAIPVSSAVALSYSNANNITLPIYGLLTLPGPTRAGTYTDTLTVTLSW
ncbi:Spore coat protein U (SCPU) domain-containing protein [Candidatus Pantoea symbiotica]|uniref:Spore coat protein U (SCPU) domain-containing protein n=2 Tax=Gammaproteobacteria TaxID=1236 RepID=A0A1I3V1J4_9GAMM|nr:spore coat protein U-like protein [Enterobacter sp. Sphag1F]MRS19749.1 fimbrial major subunit CsuA/B family protein [Enterobacteriaceae bacterium RIT692]MRT24704.1 fimbrial major subunit CsuA/B family protein [Enterobacteriaceae bacterium RIT697]MRT41462.1 fimbrial major subunit CsuA/B family protein [Enterobacteriaceae bacterium RIT702]SFJ89544.1 Spore coat protein U (SCPU) domain-containing protein [Pantoea symbiotica]SFU62703.1 Spore coat protein U (SCPU) domain-containing protein [Panto